MGEVRLPAEALWRAQAQRVVENFPDLEPDMERAPIRARGLVKGAAARMNVRLGVLGEDVARTTQFPDGRQRGDHHGGRPGARGCRCTRNDDVNASQSSNGVFPHNPRRRDRPPEHRGDSALEHLTAPPGRRLVAGRSGAAHAPDGHGADHVGPGGRRRGHQAEYGAAQLRDCYRGCPSCCLSAAPRSAPASEHPGRDRRKRGRRAASATGLGVLTDAADHMDAQGAQNGLISAFGARRTVAVSL
jgi:fumarate hydratase class II